MPTHYKFNSREEGTKFLNGIYLGVDDLAAAMFSYPQYEKEMRHTNQKALSPEDFHEKNKEYLHSILDTTKDDYVDIKEIKSRIYILREKEESKCDTATT